MRAHGRMRGAQVLVFFLTTAFGADRATAGHPLGTEDAETRGRGNIEVEFNYERSHGGDENRQTKLGNIYTVGISQKVDLAVSLSYLFRKPDSGGEGVRGMGDTEVTMKTAIIDGAGWKPTIGVKAGALLPTGDEKQGLGNGRASVLFTAIADWESGPVKVHANAKATLAGRPIGSPDRDDRILASLAAEWELRKSFFLLGEYLWEKNIGASGPAPSELLVGGKMVLYENLTLDAGIRWGTNSSSPSVVYLAGVTLAFRHDPAPGGKAPNGGGVLAHP